MDYGNCNQKRIIKVNLILNGSADVFVRYSTLKLYYYTDNCHYIDRQISKVTSPSTNLRRLRYLIVYKRKSIMQFTYIIVGMRNFLTYQKK